MSRVTLCVALVIAVCLSMAGHLLKDSDAPQLGSGTAGTGEKSLWQTQLAGEFTEPAASYGPENSQPAEIRVTSSREVLWRPPADGQRNFDFIPTVWTARPQLLPGTWEVKTVYASDDSSNRSLSKGASR
jgi:hypothetical protein